MTIKNYMKTTKRTLGTIGVDSGTMMFCDPCYVIEEMNKLEEEYFSTNPPIDWEEFCKTRLVTLKEGVNGSVVNLNNDSYADGAIMNTGFGDGAYQVEIEEGDFGEFGKRVVSAKITFIEPHDHVVFDKLTYDYLQENEVKDCSEMQIDLKTPYAMYGNVEGISKEVA